MKKLFIPIACTLILAGCGGKTTQQQEGAQPVNTIERTGEGIPLSKDMFTYDANGNVIEQIRFDWNNRAQEFNESIKYVNTYDARGNRVTQILYSKVDSTTWVNSSKYEAEYNSADKVTKERWYAWDNDAQQWIDNARYEYQYDGSNMRTSEVNQYFDRTSQQWINAEKTDYQNSADKKESIVTRYEWKDGQWIVRNNDIFSYDKNGRQIGAIYQAQDSTNAWKPFCKKEFIYDEFGRETDERTYQLDANGKWNNMMKVCYKFDEQGNKASATTFTRQGEGWRSAKSYVYEHIYE